MYYWQFAVRKFLRNMDFSTGYLGRCGRISQAALEGKPCRKACSQEAEASAGVWGVPSQRFRISEKDILKHCWRVNH